MIQYPKIALFVFFLFMGCLASPGIAIAENEKILFLNHSTGRNVYNDVDVSAWISGYNIANGTDYDIRQRPYPAKPYPWNNYPYDYWNLWINGECNSNEPGIECLNTMASDYDVIIFKHCYPGADILASSGSPSVNSDRKSLENYKLQYRALRTLMDSYPETIFIVWTLPPRHRLATNAENAARAAQFVDWVKNSFLTEDGESHPNIFIFDFWGIVAEQDQNPENGVVNCLKYDYERDHGSGDSHPNTQANEIAGPLFAERIVSVIEVFQNGGSSDSYDSDSEGDSSDPSDEDSDKDSSDPLDGDASGDDSSGDDSSGCFFQSLHL